MSLDAFFKSLSDHLIHERHPGNETDHRVSAVVVRRAVRSESDRV
jgi:hypothetical protein